MGNAICLGLSGEHRGRVYFWDHENEPDPDEWDGEVETAGNLTQRHDHEVVLKEEIESSDPLTSWADSPRAAIFWGSSHSRML